MLAWTLWQVLGVLKEPRSQRACLMKKAPQLIICPEFLLVLTQINHNFYILGCLFYFLIEFYADIPLFLRGPLPNYMLINTHTHTYTS